MAQFQTIAVFFALSTFSAHAATIVGDLPGLLAYTSVTVPLDPTGAIIPLMSSFQQFDETFTFTVNGAQGDGRMLFQLSLESEAYTGTHLEENLSSYAQIGMLPYWPNISTYTPNFMGPINGGTYGIPITFGEPVTIEFVGYALTGYSYSAGPGSPGVVPDLQGMTFNSYVRFDGIAQVQDSNFHSVDNAVVTVVDPPSAAVPEPSTAVMLLGGLLSATALYRRSTLRQRS